MIVVNGAGEPMATPSLTSVTPVPAAPAHDGIEAPFVE